MTLIRDLPRDSAIELLNDPDINYEKIEDIAYLLSQDRTSWKDDKEIIIMVATHKRCTSKARMYLTSTSCCFEMAKNIENYKDVAEILTQSKDVEIRRIISSNVKLDTKYLPILAKDIDDEVRMNVASNPRCPSALLISLSENDPDPRVRKIGKKQLEKRESEKIV